MCSTSLAYALAWHEKTEVRTEPAESRPPPPPVQDDKLGEFYTVERILKKERNPKTKRLKFYSQIYWL